MDYTLIRSPRRRRSLSLRVTAGGEIIVRAPRFTPTLFIDRFVASKSAWISKQRSRAKLPPAPSHFTQPELENYIAQELTHYSQVLKLSPTSIRFKQVRSYWGNCSVKGVLSFNLSLRSVPPLAVSYVVVHELVHLKHRGHGKRFWSLVEKTYPESDQARRLLRSMHKHYSCR